MHVIKNGWFSHALLFQNLFVNTATFKNILFQHKCIHNSKEKSWSRGLVKSRLKNGRESRSRETEVGEKIAATSRHVSRGGQLPLQIFADQKVLPGSSGLPHYLLPAPQDIQTLQHACTALYIFEKVLIWTGNQVNCQS